MRSYIPPNSKESDMPDPQNPPVPGQKTSDGKSVDPTGKEAVDPAVADADDLATDAEKAQDKDAKGRKH